MKYLMEYSLLVLCLVFCVKCQNNDEIGGATPVLEMSARMQTTHVLNPLKLNIPSEVKPFTTAQDILLNPTPTFKPLQTTGAAESSVSAVPANNRLSTTFIANNWINPTPVLNIQTRLETGAGNPIASNFPVNQPLTTTSVATNRVIIPSQVVINIGTTPVAIALTNNEESEPEPRPSTGLVDRNVIEPSQVSLDVVGSVTQAYTSSLEQEPEQLSTKSTNGAAEQIVRNCECKSSEYLQTAAPLNFVPLDPVIESKLQSITSDLIKLNELAGKRPEFDMRPLLLGLQLHLHIHNYPVLAPYAVPLRF